MAQVTDYTIPASPLTMAGLKTALEAAFSALGTCNSGGGAPDNPFEGMLWWDTSGDPVELLKRYTVAMGWVTLLSVNNTTGAVVPYRSGTALGTMAVATATDYITKALFDAQTILAAVDDNVPAPVEIAAQRIVGRKTGGNIAGLTLSEILDMIGSAAEGDILYRGSASWARLAKGAAKLPLRMNAGQTAPEYAAIEETGLTLADNTTGDVSTSKHGFCPKAPNDTAKFLRGDGTWAVGGVTAGSITQTHIENTTAADILLIASNSEATITGTTYTKLKEIYIPRAGVLRIKFDLASNSLGYGRIYRNGAAVGTERTRASSSYATYSEDISGWSAGDLCQLYVKSFDSAQSKIRNFQLYAQTSFDYIDLSGYI